MGRLYRSVLADAVSVSFAWQCVVQWPGELPWEAIRFRIAGACYGGRLTDERDMRLLRLYCNDCFNQQVLSSDFRFQGLPQYPMPENTSLVC